jgi:hypothetical protein
MNDLDLFISDGGDAAELIGIGAGEWLRSDRLVEVER